MAKNATAKNYCALHIFDLVINQFLQSSGLKKKLLQMQIFSCGNCILSLIIDIAIIWDIDMWIVVYLLNVSSKKVYRNGNIAWLSSTNKSWRISNDFQDKRDKVFADQDINMVSKSSSNNQMNWTKMCEVIITAMIILGCSSILLYESYYCFKR